MILVGRERELEELGAVASLRPPDATTDARIFETPAPLVVVYGGASTGKSASVAQALRLHAELAALVDCTAVYSASELYREVLAQLHGLNGDSAAGGADGGAVASELSIDGVPEEQQLGGDGDNDDNDDDDVVDDAAEGGDSGGLSAVARAKRARALQKRRQQQREVDGRRVRFEGGDSALNFLGFVKALDNFVAGTLATTGSDSASSSVAAALAPPRRRVVYLALDQADKLLDRGLAPLLTCIFTINEQLAYLNTFSDATWSVSVLLITRAMSLELDRLASPFFPAYIHFPPYTDDQVADILVEQLGMQAAARVFRRWLLHLSSLVPASQGDWLEFRRHVVHLLPDFRAYFSLVTSGEPAAAAVAADDTPAAGASDKQVKKLMRATNERVSAFEKARRRHLFGHDKLQRSGGGGGGGGDPTDAIACGDLSRSCLLLVVAGFLASFNPQDTDTNFLSSSGGVRRVKRAKKSGQPSASAAAQISQLLIGPRIFTLQRLLAIYLNLRAEATADLCDEFTTVEAREDIFVHLATLVRMQLFQRTSPPNMLDDIKFRCLADSRFVHETARFLRFPLESYLNTAS